MQYFSPNRFGQYGQSLSEYSLVFGLVVIMGIVGLGTLGTQVSGLLGNTLTTREIPTQLIAGNLVNFPGSQNIVFTGKNGQQFIIDNYPTSLQSYQQAIETVGTGGITEYYAKLFEQLANIDDDTLLSEADKDALRTLAQQGFEMTKLNKSLEESATQYGFSQIKMPDGQLKSISPMNALLFINQVNGMSTNFSEVSVDQAMDGAPNSQLFKNPQMRAFIQDAALKVQSSGKSGTEILISKLNGDSPPSDQQAFYKTLADLSGKAFTGSNNICSSSATGTTNAKTLTCEKRG